jgi:hypothetical protein
MLAFKDTTASGSEEPAKRDPRETAKMKKRKILKRLPAVEFNEGKGAGSQHMEVLSLHLIRTRKSFRYIIN